MAETVTLGREVVTVADTGTMTCSCGPGPFCSHIEAVASGDSAAFPPGALTKALKLIDPNFRIQVLTKLLDKEKDSKKREALEAGIAHLLKQLGR